MKEIQFQGTEQELYNLQNLIEMADNSLPKEVQTRVYVVDTHDCVNKHHSQLTDEEFIELAEKRGTVYSLKYFQEDFNIGKYEIHYVIRFINIEV